MLKIFIGLKKTCLGVLERGERDKANETGLKGGRRNRNVNYSASIHYYDNYNLVYSDTTKFQLFDFLVYTVWACWKATTQ